jgi:hypothetical protein
MAWPTPQDYNEAVQNPRLAFPDAELGSGQPELTPLGLPKAISGGFACVYKIQCSSRLWAARCFQTEITDQQERYEAIDRHLAKVGLPYMVRFGYQAEGVRVRGRGYPLLKMEWVRGVTLSSYVGSNLSSPATIGALAEKWVQMLKALQQAEVAHGDLQHGNVLVVGGELRLIDYDGMFVPELAGKFSNEVGHRNYQHPHRMNIDYGAYLDNFSGWVVYAALLALSDQPDLWRKYDGGDECLLFRRDDFDHPQGSAVFRDMLRSTNANVRALGDFLERLSSISVLDVPAVDVGSGAAVTGAVPTTSAVGGGEWWKDHAEDNQPGAQGSGGTGAGGPDVGWIVEGAAAAQGPVERAKFQGSFKGIRVLACGSFAAVIVTGLAAGLPVVAFVGLSLSVIGLIALACFQRYRGDPSLEEYRVFKKALAELLSEAAAKWNERKKIDDERSAIVGRMSAAQADWSNKRRRIDGDMQQEFDKLRARLAGLLRLLDEQRRTITEREGAELRSLQGRLSDRIAGLERKIAGLSKKETDEKEQALRSGRELHIDLWMRGFPIEGSYVQGIGAGNAARLAARGFVTAADLNRYGFTSIPGIGPKRTSALIGWRDRIRAKGEASAPASLPRADAARIEGKFVGERSRLVSEKSGLEGQLRSAAGAVRSKYAGERGAVERDDRSHRDVNARDEAALRQRYGAQILQLDKDVQAQRMKDQGAVTALTEKLREFDKGFSVLQWQCAKKQREWERFGGLGFTDFLRSMAGL